MRIHVRVLGSSVYAIPMVFELGKALVAHFQEDRTVVDSEEPAPFRARTRARLAREFHELARREAQEASADLFALMFPYEFTVWEEEGERRTGFNLFVMLISVIEPDTRGAFTIVPIRFDRPISRELVRTMATAALKGRPVPASPRAEGLCAFLAGFLHGGGNGRARH